LTEIVLTRKAAALLYASPVCLVAAASCYRQIAAVVHSEIKTFVLEPDGTIRCKGEIKRDMADTIPLPGAPAGLFGIVVGQYDKQQTTALIDTLKVHDIEILPPVLTLASAPTFWRRYLCRQFINSFLLDRFLGAQKNLASCNRQLVQQRQTSELLQMQLEKARHMISGVGYETRYVTVDLSPSNETLGPGGTIDVTEYQQVLPVSCAGINGVSLYVERLPEQVSTGHLIVSVKRIADSKVLLEQNIPVSGLVKGWNSLLPSEVQLASIGDTSLQVSWYNADGVLLALSDVKTERFGTDKGQTLALRVYQSLIDPASFDNAPQIDSVLDIPSLAQSLQMKAMPLPDMSDNFSFYRGYEAHAQLEKSHGFPIATLNGETRVLQLHPVTEGLAATVYKAAIPAGTVRVACEVATAHVQAPAFTYILAAIPSNADFNVGDCIEGMCERVKQNDTSGTDKKTGVAWYSAKVHAIEKRLLELDFSKKTKVPMDVIFAVIPVENDMRFGWCRWYRFFITSKSASLQGKDQ